MTTMNMTPRNQRFQDQEPVTCHQCGMGFHCSDASAMTTSVYWHFEGESFCSTNCLHDRKGGVPRSDWRTENMDYESDSVKEAVDDYGYPLSLYED